MKDDLKAQVGKLENMHEVTWRTFEIDWAQIIEDYAIVRGSTTKQLSSFYCFVYLIQTYKTILIFIEQIVIYYF